MIKKYKIKKSFLIIGIVIVILITIINLYVYKNDIFKKMAYIDIANIDYFKPDIDLYGEGSGINEFLYTGDKPIHYLIYLNGNVYTYKDSSFKHKITGIKRPSELEFKKHISSQDIKNIKEMLLSSLNKYELKNDSTSSFWTIKIGICKYKLRNINKRVFNIIK